MNVQFKLMYLDAAPLPQPLEGNAGIDLPAYGEKVVVPNEITTIGTGVAVAIPDGYCGLVLGRSGNGFKRDFTVFHIGLIDSSYRGEIFVRVINKGFRDLEIKHGDLFAQLLIIPAPRIVLQQSTDLSFTVRGEKGLGSSGILRTLFDDNAGSL